AKRDAKYLLVLGKKQGISAHDLCAGLPAEFEEYMHYVHDLRDEDQPDYQHLRKMFGRLFRRRGYEYDNVFDWTIREFLKLEPAAKRLPERVGGLPLALATASACLSRSTTTFERYLQKSEKRATHVDQEEAQARVVSLFHPYLGC
ncbi:hypothetical protein LTR06_011559, partial [Exophiala xenobiotica]